MLGKLAALYSIIKRRPELNKSVWWCIPNTKKHPQRIFCELRSFTISEWKNDKLSYRWRKLHNLTVWQLKRTGVNFCVSASRNGPPMGAERTLDQEIGTIWVLRVAARMKAAQSGRTVYWMADILSWDIQSKCAPHSENELLIRREEWQERCWTDYNKKFNPSPSVWIQITFCFHKSPSLTVTLPFKSNK